MVNPPHTRKKKKKGTFLHIIEKRIYTCIALLTSTLFWALGESKSYEKSKRKAIKFVTT